MGEPSGNGSNGAPKNGRDPKTGQFVEGWKGGPGNPNNGKVLALRRALLATVTEQDVKDVIAKLVSMAKKGDRFAIRELLDRTLGKPKSSIDVQLSAMTEQQMDQEIERGLRELAVRGQARLSGPDSSATGNGSNGSNGHTSS